MRCVILVVVCAVSVGCGGPKTLASLSRRTTPIESALPTTGEKCGLEVSGDVTFAGRPIPRGRIYFNPDFTKGNDGPQGYAEIEDGKFDTRKTGRGACGGPAVVAIDGFDVDNQRLFKSFTIAIDLPREACTQNFDVPAADDLVPPAPGGKI